MAQQTYGSITITDLTDITNVFLQYGKANSSATVTNDYTFSGTGEIGWFTAATGTVDANTIYFQFINGVYKVVLNPSSTTGLYVSSPYPTWSSGFQIWIRQVTIKEGIDEPEYGTPYLDTAVNQINNTINIINSDLSDLTQRTGRFWTNEEVRRNGQTYDGVVWTKPDYLAGTYLAQGLSNFAYNDATTYGYNTFYGNGIVLRYNQYPLTIMNHEGIQINAPTLDNNNKINGSTKGTVIDSTGLEVFKHDATANNGNGADISVAKFGTTARIGKTNEAHIVQTSTGLNFVDSVGIIQASMTANNGTFVLEDVVSAHKIELGSGLTIKNNQGEILASFGADGAQIGKPTEAHSIIDADGQSFYASNGTTQLANIGYGAGTAESGTSTAPYYTFGERKATTTVYDSSSTYDIGDICVYDNELYVCIEVIETVEAWNPSHWQLAIGNYSSAEGLNIIASGSGSHAEGSGTRTIGRHSHAEGWSSLATGLDSHAEGYVTKAMGAGSHAEGFQTTASGMYSHAEGDRTTATDSGSHAEGSNTTAIGNHSHAEGYGTNASNGSHAEGSQTTASGTGSHAEGYKTTASGIYSHAEGSQTIAGGNDSHAEGSQTTASGTDSHAEGNITTASALCSHAEGDRTTASGMYSHAQNKSTIAGYTSQTTIGKYNDNQSNTALEIGNGSADARSNALTVDWNGNVQASGLIKDTLQTTAPTITRSTGASVSAIQYRRSGHVAQLRFTYTYSTSVAAGANLFTGTLASGYRPTIGVLGVSYYGSNAIIGAITTDGAITLRNASSTALTASSGGAISFTYIID